MEKNILKLKAAFYPQRSSTYSICMRGARIWNKNEPLYIFTHGRGDLIDEPIKVEPDVEAEIISQQHYRFQDIHPSAFQDNYDKKVQNFISLEKAMVNAYGETFDVKEIITLLRFKIS